MSKKLLAGALLTGLAAIAMGVPNPAEAETVRAKLQGVQEVPAVSSAGTGSFRAKIRGDENSFELSYAELEGNITQAHIHFAQKGVNGGISVFLCTNLGSSPVPVQACPPSPATISGVITAADVIGPIGQNIQAGELDRLIEAIRKRATYINVHTDLMPTGEIRGQVRRRGGDDDEDKDKDDD